MAKKPTKTKPQLKNIDELFGLDGSEGNSIAVNGTEANGIQTNGKLLIQEIGVDDFVPFKGHPFRIYQGERFTDMLESIKANGVLVPVVARQMANGKFEILAGHNRINAAKAAMLKTVPTVILEDITDDEAMVYVVETNLMQRSFTDMLHSEKARVIAMHHNKMFSQGKRNDILEQLKALENPDTTAELTADNATSSHNGTKLNKNADKSDPAKRTDEKIGAMYSLARNTIARYVRVDKLVHELKVLLDDGTIPFLAAVEISFLRDHEQHQLTQCLKEDCIINVKKATALRNHSKTKTLDADTMKAILAGNKPPAAEIKPRRVNISGEFYGKYFKPEQSAQEVEHIVEEALLLYFENRRGLAE